MTVIEILLAIIAVLLGIILTNLFSFRVMFWDYPKMQKARSEAYIAMMEYVISLLDDIKRRQ